MASNFGLATPKNNYYSKDAALLFWHFTSWKSSNSYGAPFPDSINTKTISAGELEAKL